MEIIIFIIPFITAAILVWKFRKETVWWEYIVLILPSLLFALLVEFAFKSSNTSDVEYLGDYVTKVTYYEEWDEMVWVTHTRRVYAGSDSNGRPRYRTETYRVLERKYHPERWEYRTAHDSWAHRINKAMFQTITRALAVEPVFIDMNRNYHSIDGDVYEWNFSGDPNRSYSVTDAHRYSNPIKGSRSIFKFEKITDEEAKKLGLFNYNEIVNLDQSPIQGIKVGPYQERKIRWINGYYGPEKQFRMYMLFFKNQSEAIAEKQRSYWEGGNKNELVCCVGLDKANKITWVRCFSWEDTPNLSVKSQNWLLTHSLDLSKFSEYITPLIQKEWRRKQFDDFSYLSIEISDGQYIALLIMILLYNIGISIWLVKNDFKNK